MSVRTYDVSCFAKFKLCIALSIKTARINFCDRPFSNIMAKGKRMLEQQQTLGWSAIILF